MCNKTILCIIFILLFHAYILSVAFINVFIINIIIVIIIIKQQIICVSQRMDVERMLQTTICAADDNLYCR